MKNFLRFCGLVAVAGLVAVFFGGCCGGGGGGSALDLKKSPLRVLDIGNSYTEDATHYLRRLVDSSGVDTRDFYLYRAIRGGASFRNWCDIYSDADNTPYYITKVVGDLGSSVVEGRGAEGDGALFRRTLADNEWDIVVIHQVSVYAPYYDKWEESGPAGALSDLIAIIREHQPNAAIGFLMVHSYASNYSGNSEGSSYDRWSLIAESTRRFSEDYDIDFIVPYGTAIQNLRASSLNTFNAESGHYNDFTSDGTHCADGLGDYVAACCYFESLIAPRYDVSIMGNSFNSLEVEEQGTTFQGTISVTPENAPIAQRAAQLAVQEMYKCTNPEI